MRIHSKEVRQLELQALERGERRSDVSRLLSVPLPTLDRWQREFRHSGKEAPLPRGQRCAAFGPAELPRLEAQLRVAPEATLERHVQQWREQSGQKASCSSLHRALKKLGWSRKKGLRASEQNPESRQLWREALALMPAVRLVFVDECGSHTSLTPLYAYAPRHERAVGSVPKNR